MLTCTRCGQEKEAEAFCVDRSQKRRGGRSHWCRECFAAYHKDKRQNDPAYNERKRQYARENHETMYAQTKVSKARRHTELKLEIIQAYGGSCTCCGEAETHFLTIEHIGGVPDRHRWPNTGKRISGSSLLYLVKAEGFPEDITVLCFNCNQARGLYGFCPHQQHDESQRRYPALVA